MTKLSRHQIEPKQFGFYVNDLWSAFTLMDSKDDIRSLFHDIFTHTEYKMFTKRLQIARMLLDGENYDSIRNALKVTDKTIANVSNTLVEKGNGFRKAHEQLNKYTMRKQHERAEYQKDLENPFRKKIKNYPNLSRDLKDTSNFIGKMLSKKLKTRSVKKIL